MKPRLDHYRRVPIINSRFDELDKFDAAFLESLKALKSDDCDADTSCADHRATFQKLNFGDLD